MAGITVGAGATLTSPKLEQQYYDFIHLINNAEKTSNEEERFSATKDDTFKMTGTFRLPGKLNYNSTTGLFSITAEPYLLTIPFSAGTNGTIKGATLSQYFIDLTSYIILWQQTPNKNLTSQYNVSMTYNYAANEFNGEFSLPYAVSLQVGGGIVETAIEWLTT